MKLIFFFWKCTKFYVDCKNAIKMQVNVSRFWDNGVWTCVENFSDFWREYKWAWVNVLPNSPQISHPTKRVVFQLNLSWLSGNSGWTFCRACFSSDCNPWTRSLSKGVLKWELSCIKVIMFLGVNNFRNI